MLVIFKLMQSINTIQSKISFLTVQIREIFMSVKRINTDHTKDYKYGQDRITITLDLDSLSIEELEKQIPMLKQLTQEYANLRKEQDKIYTAEQKEQVQITALGDYPGLNTKIPF